MIARMIVAGVMVGIGCGGCAPVAGGGGSAASGRFEAKVADVQLLADGRNAVLLKSFAYVDGNGLRWECPAGETIDGASIPQTFWSIIGGPFEGKYRFASIVHDRYCRAPHGGRTWQQVHRMFYEACIAGGTDETLAKAMYAAVYHFGPRWSDQDKGEEELAALVPPERARMAEELAVWEGSRRVAATGPAGSRLPTAGAGPTQGQYRELVLARRPETVAPDRAARVLGTSPVLEKWDRLRGMIRGNPGVTLDQIERGE
jgi:hypothetical protein